MTSSQEYVLGTEDAELERLRFQHETWAAQAFEAWSRAGFGAGSRVLDLGCGPGFATLDLATWVGPRGRVLARDRSARYLAHLRAECERLRLEQVETSHGSVEELVLPAASLDGVYSRWLFSWLPDPEAALERVAGFVRPGGALALQEYLDWATMDLLPASATFRATIEACMRAWRELGATIDVGASLVGAARRAGLVLESVRPLARIGAVGSMEWRWLGDFYALWLPKLVAQGLLRSELEAEFRAEWARREREGASHVVTPTLVELVLRRR